MSSDQGVIIAKRSVSLSKTYPVLGVITALVGLFIATLSAVIGNLSTRGISINSTNIANLRVSTGLPFLAVPLQSLAAILTATPVLLLFVYDKNNGVLEYFLSLGMNQRDVYREYLKAALLLSFAVVVFDVIIDVVAGLLLANSGLMIEISSLVIVIALPAVSLGTLLMMSFSSLQKPRVGSNQPLGMAIGVFTVLPSYLFPLLFPSLAFVVDLLLASLIVGLSSLTYLLSGRLISREKLLP